MRIVAAPPVSPASTHMLACVLDAYGTRNGTYGNEVRDVSRRVRRRRRHSLLPHVGRATNSLDGCQTVDTVTRAPPQESDQSRSSLLSQLRAVPCRFGSARTLAFGSGLDSDEDPGKGIRAEGKEQSLGLEALHISRYFPLADLRYMSPNCFDIVQNQNWSGSS